MIKLAIALVIALTFFTGVAVEAQAVACYDRAALIAVLEGKHGEARIGIATRKMLNRPARIVEFWANQETGSWSVTETTATGTTCLLMTGQNFDAMSELAGPKT